MRVRGKHRGRNAKKVVQYVERDFACMYICRYVGMYACMSVMSLWLEYTRFTYPTAICMCSLQQEEAKRAIYQDS